MSIEQQASVASTSINSGTNIGLVTLRVAQLERSLRFYHGILGFQPIEQAPGRVVLGTQDNQPLLEVIEVPGAGPNPLRATGLYHVAIVLPTRPDLGRMLLRLAEANIEIGHGDHVVSEALYISDPDENGLELYQDRPRSTWRWERGTLVMGTEAVDLRSLAEDSVHAEAWDVVPAGTRVGHIHLKVGNIPAARRFYSDILGFDVMVQMPTALFVSAGGYHHHIGMNIWHSQGAAPTPVTMAGLQSYVIAIPTPEALQEVKARLVANNVSFTEEQPDLIRVNDPWQNTILLKVQLITAQ
jgi:catechol 2,3-dioxygenase